MISIRKAWWATLLLTAFVGCTNEEPAGENPPPTPPSTPEATAPAATPPAAEKAPEGGMSSDMNKGEPAKPEGLPPTDVAPKEEAPKEEAKELKLDAPAVTPPAKEEKKEAAATSPLTAEELAELASLSAADKDLALKQVVCPVSGENLGSMGVPLKVSAEGKTFLICCKGCNADVKENPKEVVAKLKN
jgi:hypothetical protein